MPSLVMQTCTRLSYQYKASGVPRDTSVRESWDLQGWHIRPIMAISFDEPHHSDVVWLRTVRVVGGCRKRRSTSVHCHPSSMMRNRGGTPALTRLPNPSCKPVHQR